MGAEAVTEAVAVGSPVAEVTEAEAVAVVVAAEIERKWITSQNPCPS